LRGMGGMPSCATGTLISDSFVLTSAHVLFLNYEGVKKFTPFEFCLNLHKNYDSKECIKLPIADSRFPYEFGAIYEEMFKLSNKSP
jgi:hypothetical protein